MKKTIGLFLLFLVLAGITWMVLNKKDEGENISKIDQAFTLASVDQIHKIFIADRSGNAPTELERSGKEWIYNGKYRAAKPTVGLLLDAIKRMRVKHLVPEAALENVTLGMASEGILVQLFDQSGKKIKGFYIGGMTNDERGTFMAVEGQEKPYVMHIPSWEGNLRQRFSIRGSDWRDPTIIRKKVEEIQYVSLEYPKQKNQSFVLQKEGENYTVEPLFPTTPKITTGLKRGIIESYLVNFRSLGVESFENENKKTGAYTSMVPFCIVRLKDVQGNEQEIKFHPLYPKGEDGEIVADGKEIERYFAATSEGDVVLVQHLVFQKIFWGYPLFFKE